MNGNAMRIASTAAALLLAGVLCGGTTPARAQGNNAQSIPSPKVSDETCSEVDWSPKMLAQYPRISDACQEVVRVNGENWVRIEGRLIDVTANGSVTSMVLDRKGRGMGRIVMKPAAGQKVLFEGRETTFDQLETGAILNLYIPEHMYAVATVPSTPSETAEIEPATEPEVAQQEMPESLPATAGPLPWVLLAGGGLLLAGLALSLWRRRRS